MIVYELTCGKGHRFEGWFSSAADYERQITSHLLSCPMCGNDGVSRLPHAPYVSTSGATQNKHPEPAQEKTDARGAPSQHYANLGAGLLAHLIEKVLEKTDDVGAAFPEEARKIHYGEAPDRHIRGTASGKEVDALREEGIEVVSLPVPPHLFNKTH